MTTGLSSGWRRLPQLSLVFGVAAATIALPHRAGAAPQAAPLLLTAPDASPQIHLRVEPQDGSFVFVLATLSKSGCKFPVAFILPVRSDGGVSQKRVVRFTQDPRADGSCDETLATMFTRNDFLPLTRAQRIELALPTGTIVLAPAALEYLRRIHWQTSMAPVIQRVVQLTSFADEERERPRLRYWLSRPPAERVAAVEFLRRQFDGSGPRLRRVHRVLDCPWR